MRIVEENWKVLASLFHCFPQGGGKWRGSQVRRAIASVSVA
jgi:hypothetical protein